MPGEFFTLLRASGRSKSQIARMLGVTPSAVTRWFQGTRRVPASVIESLRALSPISTDSSNVILGAEETAALLGIASATVYRALRTGHLRGVRDETGRWRVATSDARDFMRVGYNRVPETPRAHRLHRASAELIPADFAERIRNVRVSLALSQADFGKLLGVAKKTVYQWEAGKRTPWPTYWRKVRAFEVDRRSASGMSALELPARSGVQVE